MPARISALEWSPAVAGELAPRFTVYATLHEQVTAADERMAALVDSDPTVALLTSAPGIGPVTASAFVATVDDSTRFHSAHQLDASLGLVPSERSSGETRPLGRITKAGNSRMRWLLVEAAWCIVRSKSPETAALRAWMLPIARRRGKRIAVVALARRLAGVLYAMWRDGTRYDATRIRTPPHPEIGRATTVDGQAHGR